MRRLALAIALLAAPLPATAPAWAVPESGLYYQPIPGSSGNIQVGVPQGVFQLDYAPVIDRPAGGSMQVLQAALRLPAPLLEDPLTLNGLLGYRHILSIYDASLRESYGGIELGLSAALSLSELVGRGTPLSPLGLYGFAFHHQLFLAMTPAGAFTTGSLGMRSFGGGLTLELPTNGVLSLGYEAWSLPQDLGTGSPGFSQGLRTFNGLVIGYRW